MRQSAPVAPTIRVEPLEVPDQARPASHGEIARLAEDAYLALLSNRIQEKAYFLLLQRIQRLQNRQPASEGHPRGDAA
jgi:hypothetical protein